MATTWSPQRPQKRIKSMASAFILGWRGLRPLSASDFMRFDGYLSKWSSPYASFAKSKRHPTLARLLVDADRKIARLLEIRRQPFPLRGPSSRAISAASSIRWSWPTLTRSSWAGPSRAQRERNPIVLLPSVGFYRALRPTRDRPNYWL